MDFLELGYTKGYTFFISLFLRKQMIYCVNPELVCNNKQPQKFSKPILASAYYNRVNFYVNYCPYSTSLPIATCGYSNEALHYAVSALFLLFLLEGSSFWWIN